MKKRICKALCFVLLLGAGFLTPSQEIVKTPTLKEVGGFWYAYMDFEGSFESNNENFKGFADECRKQEVDKGALVWIFYTWPEYGVGDVLKFAGAYIIPEDTQIKPPLKKGKVEKIKAVIYTHTGPLEEIKKSNKVVEDYLKEKEFKIVWPTYEILYKDPLRVDIIYPVEQ